ncbi:sulfite exporter TauE/SafE family protein [Shewanella sp. D64]|uniref:sulfite exporter TauE/SafE family protein n=1 Tax=unclassified Shewanella TaxID=196818 RepID=UPI0022BA70EE|nr:MULTISPECIES: sulfite exporter TauE/SafE family protein [unclassified Shewanella]MEC4726987.1 sulfite exporter TauE/SafE family protein [Shewanella sp. D64]MEC4738516.1 sulfite exporter TauE/SafE family protein [Shewanella sp. E94]WBJ93736.1 sulfite exporter TauE/SafE family protein [Shewanella sp. MTB7]
MTSILILLLLIIVIGTYFQTSTGFGLGIIVTGAATALGLADLSFIAAVVSLITLVNCAFSLPGSIKQLDWRAVYVTGIAVIPGVIIGVVILTYLSDFATHVLQLLLGLMIIISGISSILGTKNSELKTRSNDASFFISGLASGFTGGLFGMAGPPLVFHFYRQPFPMMTIRNMLLLLFACTSATRSGFLAYQGLLTSEVLMLSALALPLVSATTLLARRYPPPLSADAMRYLVFALLMLLGGYLSISAVFDLL